MTENCNPILQNWIEEQLLLDEEDQELQRLAEVGDIPKEMKVLIEGTTKKFQIPDGYVDEFGYRYIKSISSWEKVDYEIQQNQDDRKQLKNRDIVLSNNEDKLKAIQLVNKLGEAGFNANEVVRAKNLLRCSSNREHIRPTPTTNRENWIVESLNSHKKKGYAIRISEEWAKKLADGTQVCPICGRSFDDGIVKSLDRKNNESELNENNVQIICLDCNIAKGTKTLNEFLDYCQMIVEYQHKNY